MAIFVLNIPSSFTPAHVSAATKTWTSQADWQGGTTSNIDTTSTPGSIKLSSSVGGGSIAYRSASHTGTSSSDTVNKPSGVVDGDVMIAAVSYNAGGFASDDVPTITPPAGWTLISRRTNVSAGIGLALYWKAAASEGSTYTFTTSIGTKTIGVIAFSGVDTTSPIDAQNGNIAGFEGPGFGLTHTTPSITTTVANTMIVTTFVGADSRSTWSPPSGETERYETHENGGSFGMVTAGNTEAQAAAGATGTKSGTVSGFAMESVTNILALKPGTTTTYNTPGTDTLQYDSGSAGTTWSALSWTGSTPTNTTIRGRARAAETQGGLSSASWSSYVTTSGGSINLTGRYAEVEWNLSTTDTSVTPTLADGTITYTLDSGGGGSGGGGGDTGGGSGGSGDGGSTPTPTPTPTVITVEACSAAIKNLTVTTNHVTADMTFTTTTTTKGTLYYYAASRTSPADTANKIAKNYDQGTVKVEEDAATKDHKISLANLVPNTKYYYTLVLSNGTVECEHNFTTQAPPPTPTPTPAPKPTGKPAPTLSTISGYVYEQGTTNPIPNVTVFMYKRWLFGWRTVARTNTDAQGFWQLKYEKGVDYRVRTSLTAKLFGVPDSTPRAGLEFAKAGETCPASEVNRVYMGWYGTKQLTETPCENNIFYASKVAQTSGTVVDATTNEPAPGVTVALRRKEFFGLLWRTTAYTTTDTQGKWQFAYLTGFEYQASIQLQDSSAIFPAGRKEADGTVTLVKYKANGKPATPGCNATRLDERFINWDADHRLTENGCANSTFYVTKAVDFKVQTLVDKANAPLADVQLRLLGKLNGIWRGTQDGKKTDANGIVTYSYFPGTIVRVYTFSSVPGYVQGYTEAFPGCPAKTVRTTNRINLVEWADDKLLPATGCATPTRMYMTSVENVNLAATISPAGGIFQDKVEITMSHTPNNHIGAMRYIYIDTAKPETSPREVTNKSSVYRKSFVLFKSRKVAAKFFGSESPEVSANFTITKATPTPTPTPTPEPGGTPVPDPTPTPSPDPSGVPTAAAITVTASPMGGEFDQPTTVSLSASDPTAKIFYSADGSDPTEGGTEYSAPITLSASTLLHFYATKDTTQSDMGEEEYTFKGSENPVIIDWEDDTPGPEPYIILCNNNVIGTTTNTTFIDTNLQYDGCAYRIKDGDTDITPTSITFAELPEGSTSNMPPLTDIVNAVAIALGLASLMPFLTRLTELLRYGWLNLLLLLRLRRKGTSSARVVSSTTSAPIFGATIAFSDTDHYNRIVERAFSDKEGKFPLPLRTGTYTLQISHPNYSFPSGISRQGYHGEPIHIKNGAAPSFDIPMDETNGGSVWMQRLKAQAFRVASVNTLILLVGLAVVIYSITEGLTVLNGLLVAYYVVFLVNELRQWNVGRCTVIVKSPTGKRVPLAIIRLTNDRGTIIYTRASDATGRTLITVPRGVYHLKARATTQEGQMSSEQTITITRNPFRQTKVIRLK